jgi:hypothetical protein
MVRIFQARCFDSVLRYSRLALASSVTCPVNVYLPNHRISEHVKPTAVVVVVIELETVSTFGFLTSRSVSTKTVPYGSLDIRDAPCITYTRVAVRNYRSMLSPYLDLANLVPVNPRFNRVRLIPELRREKHVRLRTGRDKGKRNRWNRWKKRTVAPVRNTDPVPHCEIFASLPHIAPAEHTGILRRALEEGVHVLPSVPLTSSSDESEKAVF